MSGIKEEDDIGEQPDCCSDEMLDTESDIIDVSSMNFGNHDSWLQPSVRNPSEYRIQDLRAWLRGEVEQENNRRSIDTRTFTRPKKRSGRLSFESIVEATTPSPDVWKPRVPQDAQIRQPDWNDVETLDRRRDSTSASAAIPTSGPESLEAFVNMSQSKGIDSFINLAEPEFVESVMNISEPSFLYSSMMSTTRDDLSSTINHSQTFSRSSNNSQIFNQSSTMDSQILTESMMQSSMFGDSEDVRFDEIFSTNNADVTIVENTSFSEDRTFVASSIGRTEKIFDGTFDTATLNNVDVMTLDATYTPTTLNKTLKNVLPLVDDPHASYIVNSNPQIFDSTKILNDVSFVINRDFANDASYIVQNETTDVRYSEKNDRDEVEDATFKLDNPPTNDNTFNIRNFDATFEKTPSSSPRKSLTTTISKIPSTDEFETKTMEPNVPTIADNTVIIDFDKKTSSSLPQKSIKNSLIADQTINVPISSSIEENPINSTFKATTKMDTTYQHNISRDNHDDVPMTNRYNTYRKTTSGERASNENYATNNLTVDSSNVKTTNNVNSLENFDTTFNKPAQQRVLRKLNVPKPLSRLPQTLQKSNPNLLTNTTKIATTVGRSSGIPSFGFSKLARPSTTGNVGKLYGLTKMKSGSEQRLEVARKTGDYKISGSGGGSTESIESTQSAHSAPDLDDRLSVCSDSSHNSYSVRTMSIKDLQKATHLRVDYAKPESTPKPNRRVLENNWVEVGKDLPSPILKNGPEIYVSRDSSPRSTASTVKTSSPLLSPVGSLQNLTINVAETRRDNNADETKLLSPRNHPIAAKKPLEGPLKPSQKPGQCKTGLKPPTNWSSANQRPTSGIPRPASRIPASRFARPAAKNNQGDTKKGCL